MSLKTAGIIANPTKASAAPVARLICERLRAAGVRVLLEPVAAGMCGEAGYGLEHMALEAEVILVIGGDGTVLRAAAQLGQGVKPLAALNAGHLGFLTMAMMDEVEAVLPQLLNGQVKVSQRSTVEAEFTTSDGVEHVRTGLNDVVVSRGSISRMVRLDVRVDGAFLNSYAGDGLIVATPTGSTAYNLSAGGPIIDPVADVLCITPICPHAVSHRSCVVAGTSVVEIDPCAQSGELMLSVDGDSWPLCGKTVVTVRRGGWTVPLVSLPGATFYGILRSKLKWTGSSL